MAWLTKAAVAAILSVAVIGCATDEKKSTSKPAASSMPCERCKFGVSDQKASPPKHYCKVDGKTVDCRKTPPECAECAKMTKSTP